MKAKHFALFAALALAALFALRVGDAAAAKKLNVVATIPDLASIARAVGGDKINVSSIALGVQDPHYLEAKPNYSVLLSRADLLIYNGLELEIGWLPLPVRGSRNSKIAPSSPGALDASQALDSILEVPRGEVDRSMGDIHPLGNPHYLLDPRNGVKVAALIRDRLSELDPANADAYKANCRAFEEMMAKKIAEWEAMAAGLKGKPVVTYHKTWEYLTGWLGLIIADYVEDKPGIPPSPRHRAELVKKMKEQKIEVLIRATYNPGLPTAERVCAETGAQLLSLPASTGGEPGLGEYPDLFSRLVPALVRELGGNE